MTNLLRLSACLFLCVSLNSFGATAYSINNGYLNSFDINTGEIEVSSENIDTYISYGNNTKGVQNESLMYAEGHLFWIAGNNHPDLIKYNLETGTHYKLASNTYNLFQDGNMVYQPSPVPLPAGIYLFLSGLVGLGLMRGRNG